MGNLDDRIKNRSIGWANQFCTVSVGRPDNQTVDLFMKRTTGWVTDRLVLACPDFFGFREEPVNRMEELTGSSPGTIFNSEKGPFPLIFLLSSHPKPRQTSSLSKIRHSSSFFFEFLPLKSFLLPSSSKPTQNPHLKHFKSPKSNQNPPYKP